MNYAAEKLERTYKCAVFANAEDALLSTEGRNYDAAVLPINPGQDIIPFLSRTLNENAVIFAGKTTPELDTMCRENGYKLYSYLEREEFAVLNAVLTAEGAVAIAINETDKALCGENVLVLGYGRIAKITAAYFSALGAKVTAAARKSSDLAWIRSQGYCPVDITSDEQLIPALADAGIIINTVPARIITGERAEAINKDTLMIELASSDCTDGETAFRVIKAGGLPGKISPITAGYIIAETIENIIAENKSC